MANFRFRFANENDCRLILKFIRSLAKYERMEDEVVATESLLREQLFVKKKAEVLFVTDGDKEVGFALFFHNFSTFLGRAGIYLEDLYIRPAYRGRGYGKDTARHCSGSWPTSRSPAAAAGWSGHAWTGISPASISTSRSGRSRWTNGPFTVRLEIRC